MEATGYVRRLRESVGHDPLLVTSVAACLRDERGRILLLRRADGGDLWGFPGGAMELGEGAVQSMAREVREETGLEVEPVALIGVYSSPEHAFAYPNGDQVQPVTIFFECRILSEEPRPDLDEILDARYFGPEDELPPMRPCCIDKARDAFLFRGQPFLR